MSSPSSFGRTPESYSTGLRRKDSKHALTTCHGVTSNGKACRRALGGANSPNGARYTIEGTVVIPHRDQDPAVFFCWQHKDQSETLRTGEADVVEVQERTSLESVFRNLGLEEVEEAEEEEEPFVPSTPTPTPVRRKAAPLQSGFIRTVADHAARHPDVLERPKVGEPAYEPKHPAEPRYNNKKKEHSKSKPQKSKDGDLLSIIFGCLMLPPDERDRSTLPRRRPNRQRSDSDLIRHQHRSREKSTPPRTRNPSFDSRRSRGGATSSLPSDIQFDRQRQPTQRSTTNSRRPLPTVITSTTQQHGRKDSGVATADSNLETNYLHPNLQPRGKLNVFQDPRQHRGQSEPYIPPQSANASRPVLVERRPINGRSVSSPGQTQITAEWMPTLPPNSDDGTRIAYAKLLTTLSQPPTEKDDEGYIYIFWQTDEEQTEAETNAAASLISGPSCHSTRTQEQILERRFFQTSANATLPPAQRRTIFLKIGRASNVQKRMMQWRNQCGYNFSLLRYYPLKGEKVVYVGKVEKLIHQHMEMLGQRVRRSCRCGREHQEWFEVEATPKAVKEVDVVIRQYVEWSQQKYGT